MLLFILRLFQTNLVCINFFVIYCELKLLQIFHLVRYIVFIYSIAYWGVCLACLPFEIYKLIASRKPSPVSFSVLSFFRELCSNKPSSSLFHEVHSPVTFTALIHALPAVQASLTLNQAFFYENYRNLKYYLVRLNFYHNFRGLVKFWLELDI